MARKQSESLTQREAQVMEVLWSEGESTAEAVRQALEDDLHDSTVRTILRVLESKRQVVHASNGKSYVYKARVPRARAEGGGAHPFESILQRFRGTACVETHRRRGSHSGSDPSTQRIPRPESRDPIEEGEEGMSIALWLDGKPWSEVALAEFWLFGKLSVVGAMAVLLHFVLGSRRNLLRSQLWNALAVAWLVLPAAALLLPGFSLAWSKVELTDASHTAPASIPHSSLNLDAEPSTETAAAADATFVPVHLEKVDDFSPSQFIWMFLRSNGVRIVLLLQLATSIVLLFRLALGAIAVAALRKRAEPIEDDRWLSAIEYWRGKLGVARGVKLFCTKESCSPLQLGWLEPAVLVPERLLETAGAEEINAVVVHELAHVKRNDYFWNLLLRIETAIFWLNPLSSIGALLVGVGARAGLRRALRAYGGGFERLRDGPFERCFGLGSSTRRRARHGDVSDARSGTSPRPDFQERR